MFGHQPMQPLVVYLCVSECYVCPLTGCYIDRRMMNGWLWNFYKYVTYNTANNMSTFSMSGTILPTMCQILVVIQWPN